jgi:hypothetical protein
MMIGKEDHPEAFVTVDVQDYQSLKEIEDRASDIVLCLDSTADTLGAFMTCHRRLQTNPAETEYSTPPPTTDTILITLLDMQREVAYSRKRVEALLMKTQNTRALVISYSAIVSVYADFET